MKKSVKPSFKMFVQEKRKTVLMKQLTKKYTHTGINRGESVIKTLIINHVSGAFDPSESWSMNNYNGYKSIQGVIRSWKSDFWGYDDETIVDLVVGTGYDGKKLLTAWVRNNKLRQKV